MAIDPALRLVAGIERMQARPDMRGLPDDRAGLGSATARLNNAPRRGHSADCITISGPAGVQIQKQA